MKFGFEFSFPSHLKNNNQTPRFPFTFFSNVCRMKHPHYPGQQGNGIRMAPKHRSESTTPMFDKHSKHANRKATGMDNYGNNAYDDVNSVSSKDRHSSFPRTPSAPLPPPSPNFPTSSASRGDKRPTGTLTVPSPTHSPSVVNAPPSPRFSATKTKDNLPAESLYIPPNNATRDGSRSPRYTPEPKHRQARENAKHNVANGKKQKTPSASYNVPNGNHSTGRNRQTAPGRTQKQGKATAPRLPSTPPPASSMYVKGPPIAYESYLRPMSSQSFPNHVYEQIEGDSNSTYASPYVEMGRQDSGYMEVIP